MITNEQTEELRDKLSLLKAEMHISNRELAKRIGYSDSQLGRFLSGKGYRINDSTYRCIRAFLSKAKSAETFEPIDIAIEHLERAKSEMLKAQEHINELTSFLVKKVGDMVKLREFLLGRR